MNTYYVSNLAKRALCSALICTAAPANWLKVSTLWASFGAPVAFIYPVGVSNGSQKIPSLQTLPLHHETLHVEREGQE